MEERYECSYCEREAEYVGHGTDGDFYCERHAARAPGRVDRV